MKKLAIAGLVAGTVLTFAPGAHAAQDPTGFLCGFSSVTDPQVEGSQTGEIDAALVLTDDTDPTKTYTGYVKCTIQTGINSTHAGANAAVLSGSTGPGPVAAVAGTVTYEVGADEDVYICTEVVGSGGTQYYDDVNGVWSSSNTVGCALAISAETPDPGPVGGELDPIICGPLATVFGGEGDITFPDPIGKFWDCPPYDA